MSAMEAQFERKYYLRTSDFDCRWQLQPASILDLFQDVAGAHAAELGIGGAAMMEKQLMWVLTKVKFQVLAQPDMFQPVTVRTWPLAPSRIGFQREYQILGEEGELLVKGSSQWVLVHCEKRCFMPVKDVYPMELDFRTEQMFEGKMARIRDQETQGEPYRLRPGYSELDINGHVNNTKYANFVLDAWNPGEDEVIESFQIDYHREVQGGTELALYLRREDKTLVAGGRNGAGEHMFACRIDLQ